MGDFWRPNLVEGDRGDATFEDILDSTFLEEECSGFLYSEGVG